MRKGLSEVRGRSKRRCLEIGLGMNEDTFILLGENGKINRL